MRLVHAVMVGAAALVGSAANAWPDRLAHCLRPADPDAIIRACSAALEHGSLSKQAQSRAYTRRGAARHRKKHYALAIADHDHAIRLDPANADAYANRGAVRTDLAIGLTASALPSWTLTEDAMGAAKRAAADHRKALSLAIRRR